MLTVDSPVSGDEDCLFLNMFTPVLPSRSADSPIRSSSSLIPVMFYIHGGGFALGSGKLDPSPLLEKGVLVVSVNYRLSALGFLSLPTSMAPGNQVNRKHFRKKTFPKVGE